MRASAHDPPRHPDGQAADRPAGRRATARPAAARVLLPRVRRRAPAHPGRPGAAAHRGDTGRDRADVAYALRWRAIDPCDYDAAGRATGTPGLVTMPAHDRMGAPVLGTGFAPSGRHLIPEFVTADFADLPMPANATLVAYAAGRRRGRALHLPAGAARLAADGRPAVAAPARRAAASITPDQEYVPARRPAVGGRLRRHVPRRGVRGRGRPAGRVPGAGDDPGGPLPGRDPEPAAPSTRRWRDAPCRCSRQEAGWLRLRLCRPDPDGGRPARRTVLRARRLRGLGAAGRGHRPPGSSTSATSSSSEPADPSRASSSSTIDGSSLRNTGVGAASGVPAAIGTDSQRRADRVVAGQHRVGRAAVEVVTSTISGIGACTPVPPSSSCTFCAECGRNGVSSVLRR